MPVSDSILECLIKERRRPAVRWLEVQNGCDRDQMFCDPVPRFIRNGRDLGQYVHSDEEIMILRCDRKRRPGAPGC